MPHFTIEAQGETNPLTSRSVFEKLVQASGGSQSLQGIRVATEQLSNWEKRPNFYSYLQDIYADFSVDRNIRFQAIIYLKNGIDKHWRKGSSHTINKAEKQKIRSLAIEAGVREPKHELALQNALMIAKIVRYEFPHDWPEVMTTVVGYLRDSTKPEADHTHLTNILTITLQIIKELATGRLQRTRQSLQAASSELFQVLGNIYVQVVAEWLEPLKTHTLNETHTNVAATSYLTIKTIRRLIIAGFEHPHRHTEVQQFWTVLDQHRTEFWRAWKDFQPTASISSYFEMLAKHLFQMSKLYLDMSRTHPASFILLPGTLNLLESYWTTITELGKQFAAQQNQTASKNWNLDNNGENEGITALEKIGLKGLMILRACVKMVYQPTQTFKYQQPQDKEDRKAAVDLIKSTLLTESFVPNIMETLVLRFFSLRASDLHDWQEEPDEWERREEEVADAWEFSTRACAQKLFLDLVINFKELLVPRLLQVFSKVADPSYTDIFVKDNVYSAVGIAAACIEDQLDFNTFLVQTLLPETINPQANRILRRRAAILLGQWVPIKPDTLDRLPIYRIFTSLLNKDDNDMVVRVTTGRQLRLVLEPFEFKFDDFAPFATTILGSMMQLIHEVGSSETQMALLETVRVAVTKLEGHIEPYADAIMNMLPGLWEQSGEQHLMKQAILTMITAIITSLKEKSLTYHPAILPLIRDSVNPQSEAVVYLLEEALDLWTAILQQTPSTNPPPSEELLSLYTSLLPLAQMGSDRLQQTFELIESYVILSPLTVWQPDSLNTLLSALISIFAEGGNGRLTDFQKASHLTETLLAVISVPAHFATTALRQEALSHLLSSMLNTVFLAQLLSNLEGAHTYHLDPRPSRKPPDVIGPKETSIFSILSHLFLLNPSTAVAAIETESPDSMTWLVEEWISHFDTIGGIHEKKLHSLALTHLLSASSPPPLFMLSQLQSLLTIWTDVIIALGDDAPEDSQGDYLWYGYASETTQSTWIDETPEDGRKRALSKVDPVHTNNIRVYVAEHLRGMIEAVGGLEVFQPEWLSRVDSAVVQAFADLKLL